MNANAKNAESPSTTTVPSKEDTKDNVDLSEALEVTVEKCAKVVNAVAREFIHVLEQKPASKNLKQKFVGSVQKT